MKKVVPRILIAVLSAGLLLSQSLVDISKAEQERREKLKGKNVKVITNDDLKSIRKTPAVQTLKPDQSQAPPGSGGQAETEEQEEPAAAERESRALPEVEPEIAYARRVLPETYLVKNPEYALGFPDGRYAEISMLGLLDLDFSARNGPGDDIAIFARSASGQEGTPADEGEGVLVGPFEGSWTQGFWYGVLVSRGDGEWEAIGRGTGVSQPEKFDLGGYSSITKIRIIFKPHNNPDLPVKLFRIHSQEKTIGIDAVEALH